MSTAVCLIVKNEVENIAEWVAHNAILGFDEIIVYDNESNDGTSELLHKLGAFYPLNVKTWDDEKARLSSCKQMAAYEHCLSNDGPRFDWLAYLDADEFIIPPPGSNIVDLLAQHPQDDGLALNWRIFGSNGLNDSQGRLVMEAFDRRALLTNNTNRHVKMMFRPKGAVKLINPHFVAMETPVMGVDGKPMKWSEPGITPPDGIVSGDWKLHHYIIRSRQHWERRMARKQTDGMTRDWSEFNEYDRNEVLDPSAFYQASLVHDLLKSQGFSYLDVPALPEDEEPRRVPIRSGLVQRLVPEEIVSDLRVCLDGVNSGRVHGWAYGPNSDATGLVMTPVIDGQEYAAIRCDLSRPDVLASGIAPEHVGFSFDIDRSFLDGNPHEISFVNSAGLPIEFAFEGQLKKSHSFFETFKTTIFSSVDEMQNSLLRGWVACRRQPGGELETSCSLMITANDVEIARLVADRPRPDVAAMLSCKSNCGFSVPLPLEYRTSYVQEFRFFLMPEKLEIIGSPMVTSFAQHDHAMKLSGLLEHMEQIAQQIASLQTVVRSIIPSNDLTLETYDVWQRQAAARLQNYTIATRRDQPDYPTPLISVICPVYKPDLRDFTAAIKSVQNQTYTNWELVLVDDGSNQAALTNAMKEFAEKDTRIRLVGDGKNRGISGATNQAVIASKGEWIAFFDHDDLLVDVALEVMLRAVQGSNAKLVYSDEDKVDEFGFFSEPAFKPDWNHRYLLSVNYINHLTMVSRDVVNKVGCLNAVVDGAQDHDFLLRLVEHIDETEIKHVPEILYHWRKAAQSTALLGAVKPYAVAAGVRAVSDHLERIGRPANVKSINGQTAYSVEWISDRTPLITVIIPFKDKIQMTMRCVHHILENTPYINFSIILVDNGSVELETLAALDRIVEDPKITVLRVDEEFNYSRLNNLAAELSEAEFFVFMNNDLFVQDENWLPLLLNEALADDSVGGVGGKFLFENRTIQHSGVVLGLGGVAGHVFVGEPEHYSGYGSRALLAHEVSAVTAACILVRADLFKRLGGFDEKHLKVAFNDIDLCLRIREAGFRIIMVPEFVAEHHESISRGSEDRPEKVIRFNMESDYMKQRWNSTLLADPFYNKNFSLNKTPFYDLVGKV